MTDSQTTVSIDTTHENNPKAVFMGDVEAVITPLALYLKSRSVDLFTANSFDDAVYGDYFFYVGGEKLVKDFLEKDNYTFPKTLLLIDHLSDNDWLDTVLNKNDQLKAVVLNSPKELDDSEVQRIMDFFLGSFEKKLILHEPSEREFTESSTEETSAVLLNPIHEQPETVDVVEKELIPAENQTQNTNLESHNEENDFDFSAPHESPEEQQAIESTIENLYQDDPKKTREHAAQPNIGTRIKQLSLITLFVFVVFPLATGATSSLLAMFFGYQAKGAFQNLQIESAKKNLERSLVFTTITKQIFTSSSFLFDFFGQRETHRQLTQAVVVTEHTEKGFIQLAQALLMSKDVFAGVLNQEKGLVIPSLTQSIKGNLVLADNELAQAEALMKTPSFTLMIESSPFFQVKNSLTILKSEMPTIRDGIKNGKALLTLIPKITGVQEKQTYLVLFQNNMELRPTGGFIGSYGIVTFENGSLANVHIEDVYVADGALKGHVDPPEALKTYLSAEHWYMRDSNWDPDFKTAGDRAAWFLEKETDTHVDGVIAVNLTFAQYLVESLGEVRVSDYNETITSENLWEIAQKHAEENFFPGSTQKKDFLRSLAWVMIDTLQNDNTIDKYDIFKKTYQAFQEKHALFFFKDSEAQSAIESIGWAGRQDFESNCSSNACISDYISVIDANLGVNKVNYYIEKKSKDAISFITPGELEHTLSITYKNNAPEGNELLTYKNYIRVYLSQEMDLINASLETQPLAVMEAQVASLAGVIKAYGNNHLQLDSYIEILPQQEKTLQFTFRRSIDVSAKTFDYQLLVQKQPGAKADPFAIDIKYPEDWQALRLNNVNTNVAGNTSLAEGSYLNYNTVLSQDEEVRVEFYP